MEELARAGLDGGGAHDALRASLHTPAWVDTRITVKFKLRCASVLKKNKTKEKLYHYADTCQHVPPSHSSNTPDTAFERLMLQQVQASLRAVQVFLRAPELKTARQRARACKVAGKEGIGYDRKGRYFRSASGADRWPTNSFISISGKERRGRSHL